MNDARSRTFRRAIPVLAALIALALCGCPSKPAPPPNAKAVTPTKTAPTAAEFLRWVYAALGYLENQKFAEADAELKKILDARPNDRFATRNLAIARQMQFDASDSVRDAIRFDAARAAADKAIARLQQVEPQSAVPWMLQARVAEKAGDQAARIAALRQAVGKEPDHAPAWWELYSALGGGANDPKIWEDQTARDAVLSAGRKVYALQPDNWFFLKSWILDLAAAKSPELKAVLEQFRPQIEPFAAVIERDTRANPLKLLDAALTALSNDQLSAAVAPLRGMGNLLGPELPFDLGRLKKNSLEFVRQDFDADFDREVGRPPVEEPPAIPVKFAAMEQRLPEMPGGAARDLAWVDFDVDGQADVAALTATHLVIITRLDGGTTWQIAAALEVGDGYQKLHAADLDDDDPPPQAGDAAARSPAESHQTDPDFVLAGPAGILVLENQLQADGTRNLLPHADKTPWSEVRNVTASILADLDHDGDLDIFAATSSGVKIYSQRGNFLFQDITNRSLLPPPEVQITAVAFADWDRDADLDLIVSSSAGPRLLENVRHGRFRNRPLEGALAELPAAKSIHVQDFDGNGAWDILMAGDSGVLVAWGLPNANGSGPPTLREIDQFYSRPASAAAVWDYDNDGFVDLVVETPMAVRAFRQQTPGRFQPVELLPSECTGLARPADIDQDGDLDLWTGEQPVAWRNDGGNANHWLDVRLVGLQVKGGNSSDSSRVNHEGRGSFLELRTGNRYQSAVAQAQVTHFGLGAATQADLLRIVWTNGVPQDVVFPKANATLFEEQLPIGSCPYLYTWNGERFVFCTDLLWNAPLGLRFSEDAIAPWREWEYLKIDGHNLQPRDGQYLLQLTEELWEVAYFDEVRLFAVDHPADVQVFTNEKVGPAELATPMLHTVRAPRRPVAARDTQGRDVLSLVSAADGNYAKTYDHKLAAGLVSNQFLELDLGDLKAAQRITLFLTGWLFPTDTSQRVKFSQHPTLPLPRPPSLWTPDEQGEWREAQPYMGFIGGKPKTIAVDVTDAFTPGDYRLRIATNMEFYWDDVFFTVDEEPIPVGAASRAAPDRDATTDHSAARLAAPTWRELPLLSADLHYRGFSQAVHRPGFGPEWYDYDQTSGVTRWSPLRGAYTRYGDVRPLLAERDDRLAVFGAGDEIALSFAVPAEPLPEGWVRDFVLYNVGWDKDANLNTIYGDAVEPLPFEAMTVYGETRPADAAYERFLQEYQTRRQNQGRFWNFVRSTDQPMKVQPRSRFEGFSENSD